MVKRKIDAGSSVNSETPEDRGHNALHKAATRSKKRVKPDLVRSTNALEPVDFRSQFLERDWLSLERTVDGSASRFSFRPETSKTLSAEDFRSCFNLLETTSGEDYRASSLGWSASGKRKEMREPDMHYLIVERAGPEGSLEPLCSRRSRSDAVEGFLSFMITYDSLPRVPALYIYEIHLSESVRSAGVGSQLMRVAEGVAARVGVQKVMLTCFLSNTAALRFYQKRGFAKDACSPDDRRIRKTLVTVDYVIMSKLVNTR